MTEKDLYYVEISCHSGQLYCLSTEDEILKYIWQADFPVLPEEKILISDEDSGNYKFDSMSESFGKLNLN